MRHVILVGLVLGMLTGCAHLQSAGTGVRRTEDGRCCIRAPRGCPEVCTAPCRADQLCEGEPGLVNSNLDCYVKPRCRCVDPPQDG